MRRSVVTSLLLLPGLASAWIGLTACSASPDDEAVTGQKTTQASTVSIHIQDNSGNDTGSCLGTVVAPRLVLTAGHCVVNGSTWTVEAGSRKVSAQRAVTTWKNFLSNLSHPAHTDVALLVLDEDIKLSHYPKIARTGLADGAKVSRFHRTSASAATPTSTDASVKGGASLGFRTAYVVDFPKGEYLDTGGAIVDARTGDIHGVVSGVGGKTGHLYVSRVDGLAEWINSSVSACGTAGDQLGVRTYPSSSSGGSSSGWGGSSSGWGGSSGSWGGYGGAGKSIDAGPAPDASAGAQADGGSSGGSTTGGSNTGSGTNGTNGTNGGSTTGGGGSGANGPGPNENGEVGSGAGAGGSGGPGGPGTSGGTCPSKPPSESEIEGGQNNPTGSNTGDSNSASPGSSGTTGGAGGSDTTGSGTGGGGGTGTGPGTGTGTGGGSGSGAGTPSGTTGTDQEVCEGSADNPDVCPPDTATCSGPGCGGCKGVSGCQDGVMDYGGCSCSGGGSLGSPDGLR